MICGISCITMYLRLAVLHIEMFINPYCREFRACNAIVSCAVQSYDWQRSILYIILYSHEQIVIYSHIVIVFHCRYWRDKWVNIPIQNISCSWKMHDVQRYRRKKMRIGKLPLHMMSLYTMTLRLKSACLLMTANDPRSSPRSSPPYVRQ